MVSSSRLLVSIVLMVLLLPWSTESVDLSSVIGISGDLVGSGDSSSTIPSSFSVVRRPPPQPHCWIEAIKIFHPSKQEQSMTNICENMEPEFQKALAFELARCVMSDFGKDLMEEPVQGVVGDNDRVLDPQDCTVAVEIERKNGGDDDNNNDGGDTRIIFPHLQQCLSRLTDAGANTYTQFLAHIVALCNRLTTHLAIGFQQQTAMELAKISHQTIEKFATMQASFQEREEQYRQRHQDFFDAMDKHEESLREKEASRFEAFQNWTSGLMNGWKLHDQEQKDRHDEWLRNFTKLWDENSKKLENHYQQKLATATRFLQPIFTIETWMNLASFAYRLLVIFFRSLLFCIIALIVTRPQRCRGVRGILWFLILLEGLAEIGIYSLMDDLVQQDEHQKSLIAILRPTFLSVETLIYFVNLIFSCCCFCNWFGRGGDDDDWDDYDDLTDEDERAITRAQREDMRSEFRRLLTETATTRTESVLPVQPALPSSSSPPASSPRRVPQSLPLPTSAATHSTYADEDIEEVQRPSVSNPSSTSTVPIAPGTQVITTTGIFRAADQARETEEEVPVSTSESTAAATSSPKQSLPSVTGLIQDQHKLPSGGQRSKKRSYSSDDSEEEDEDNNDNESTAENLNNGVGTVFTSPSPGKRRRVEVLEETAEYARTTTAMEEEEEDVFHSAAEDEDGFEDEEEEDDDSTVMADDDDEEGEAQDTKMDES